MSAFIEQRRANYEAYGSLRVWKALRREGIMVGRGRVERLMRTAGLVGAKRRGRAWSTTVPDPAGCERPISSTATSAPPGRWSVDRRLHVSEELERQQDEILAHADTQHVAQLAALLGDLVHRMR